jgi:SAM-dependent methyltransferase
MGIGYELIQRLLDLKRSGNLDRIEAVAEIGNQQLGHRLIVSSVLPEFLREFGASDRFDVSVLDTQEGHVVHGDTRHQVPTQPNSRVIWQAIGARYTGFDLDDDPDTVKLDLNFDSIPDGHKGQYDLVTNLGTTEHVLNQLNAFKAMHDLCRPGGLMIHDLPAGGYLTHGFFLYSPKLFWQLAKANNYIEVDGGLEMGLEPSNDYRIFASQSQYYSRRMWAPWVARQVRSRDVRLSVVLAKVHDEPFRVPLDVGDFDVGEDFSPVLQSRYPSYFGPKTFWNDVERHGPSFKQVFRHAVDEDFGLRVAAKLGPQFEEEIQSLIFYPAVGESRHDTISRYLDKVRDILTNAYRQTASAKVRSATIDLSGEDFVGVEWGARASNNIGQKWRYLGPRDRSDVLLSLEPGNDYDVDFDILDLKPGMAEILAITCNGTVLNSTLDFTKDTVRISAQVPADLVDADKDMTRIGLIAVGSPNENRPGNSLTEVPPNRASLTEMRVRPVGRET